MSVVRINVSSIELQFWAPHSDLPVCFNTRQNSNFSVSFIFRNGTHSFHIVNRLCVCSLIRYMWMSIGLQPKQKDVVNKYKQKHLYANNDSVSLILVCLICSAHFVHMNVYSFHVFSCEARRDTKKKYFPIFRHLDIRERRSKMKLIIPYDGRVVHIYFKEIAHTGMKCKGQCIHCYVPDGMDSFFCLRWMLHKQDCMRVADIFLLNVKHHTYTAHTQHTSTRSVSLTRWIRFTVYNALHSSPVVKRQNNRIVRQTYNLNTYFFVSMNLTA